ncbi:MAG: acetyl-CoA carboxylase biotin carboxylase subunit, partial [Acidimicrobiia bacterium]|nr:acetyl-CoA carboxylase biotin carboxylase subunit [Acidimicrobiia bacterium]
MINRLLIANRGEIAVRIARTAHELGIQTVGIYSESDRAALHVESMDIAVALGGETAAESYLRADAVVAAAISTGCDAVHPGYGFLAENATAAQLVIDAGLIWVGPKPDHIRLLGNKVLAKQAAQAAGVPTTAIIECDPDSIPVDVPMPALVKAAAGGGGRGMRVVRASQDLPQAVAAAAREAQAAFGDGTVFIEPYIEHSRHVEVQIFGDQYGNVIHLGERDCSVQRRNQKVIEESPSPGISAATRSLVCDGAVALATSVGYENAGTVEYLVGPGGEITFLEVNTRLQVEHPVTEMVTGLDLVELQLRIAAGQALPLHQDDVQIDGHAIEVRVVAEDPGADWVPSTGTIDFFELASSLRVDTGFEVGSEVSVNYDSLLAKVICHGPDRDTAVRRMAAGLRHSLVFGVRTNVGMLTATMEEADFIHGRATTSYLVEHPQVLDGAPGRLGDPDALLLGAVCAYQFSCRSRDARLGFAPPGWRNVFTQGQRQSWLTGDVEVKTELVMCGDHADVLVGPFPEPLEDGSLSEDTRRRASVRTFDRSEDRQVLEIDGVRHELATRLEGETIHVRSALGSSTFELRPRFRSLETEQLGGGPVCPLPGTVIAVEVSAGDSVAEGQTLVVVEAMKMEHKITA